MIPVTRFFKSLLIILMLPLCSYAGNKPDTATLTNISNEMYAAGNTYYILADALRDGFMQPGKGYSYKYSNGVFTINNKALPEPYNTQYAEKMKAILAKNGQPNASISSTANKLSVKDLVDENGSYRKALQYKAAREKQQATNERYWQVIEEMAADGVVTDANNIRMVWKGNTIRINGKKLKGATAEKYVAKLNAIDGMRTGKGAYKFSRTTASSMGS